MSILDRALGIIRGDHLPKREVKFTPADPTVNWQYVNHLVYSAGTYPYDSPQTADGNSAVFACLLAIAMGSIEPPLLVWQKDTAHGGELEPLPDSPLQEFLDNANPFLDILELRFWTAWAKHCDGNAYLIKDRIGSSTAGLPGALWPVSPLRMCPFTENGSKNFIDYYRYEVASGEYEAIPVENVLHFKLGVDQYDPRKGLSPLKRLVREIATDGEVTKFMDSLLKNFGVPGVVAQLPEEAFLTPDQIAAMKEGFNRDFGGEARGRFGVLQGGAKIEQFGFSPRDMNMDVLHNFPETRIAAVMGVDPLVARLGVGLEQTSNYASARQVRENFTELTLIPGWRLDEAVWNRALKPDFTGDKSVLVKHDLGEVRALQEDENAKATRINELFKSGLIPQQVAAKELGYDPEWEDGALFYVAPNVTFVARANIETDPNQVRQQQADAAAARAQALNAGNNNQPQPGQPPNAQDQAKASDQFGRAIQAVVDHAADGFAEDLQRLQDAQKKRLQRALVKKAEGQTV